MSNAQTAMTQTTTAAQVLARELFEQFREQSAEAEQLALQMIATGEARLVMTIALTGDRPDVALLLEPTSGDGEPVEVASTCPTEPSVQAFEEKFWFFGRLAHWQPKH